MDAILEILREKVRALSQVSNYFPPDLLRTIEENHEYNRIVDLISSTIKMKKENAYKLFIERDPEKRFLMLIDELIEETEANKLQKEIRFKSAYPNRKSEQRVFSQRAAQADSKRAWVRILIVKKRSKSSVKNWKPKKIKCILMRTKRQLSSLERFARMHPDSGDAGMLQTYFEYVLEIPFGEEAKKALNVHDVEAQLNKDHFSLKKPKQRILEYFSVKELLELRGHADKEGRGAILCFAGPPGVGKTSLGQLHCYGA